MRRYTVQMDVEALDQLEDIYRYIEESSGSSTVAERYTAAVVRTCETLANFPHRCIKRDDLYPGLRVTNHRGQTIIAYTINENAEIVTIVGFFHGGQDYESKL